MEKVTSILEAQDWFLKNSSGEVIAVNSEGDQKRVSSFPEAVEFIKS